MNLIVSTMSVKRQWWRPTKLMASILSTFWAVVAKNRFLLRAKRKLLIRSVWCYQSKTIHWYLRCVLSKMNRSLRLLLYNDERNRTGMGHWSFKAQHEFVIFKATESSYNWHQPYNKCSYDWYYAIHPVTLAFLSVIEM